MKRALTITMTVALIGSLMFMGFAGTAMADHHDKNDNDNDGDRIGVSQHAHAETNQYQAVNQQNYLKQGDNYAAAYKGTANAGNFASQTNANAQVGISTAANFADVNHNDHNNNKAY
ncbi:hypothetical protein [Natronococcus sp.]|uniref:hypothetical protein n=1 Tax=Natronococcus sp. TaxID=35747 RepID=UPI0025D3EA9D|nr:hypothetical protein [Natronococcus sp.]